MLVEEGGGEGEESGDNPSLVWNLAADRCAGAV